MQEVGLELMKIEIQFNTALYYKFNHHCCRLVSEDCGDTKFRTIYVSNRYECSRVFYCLHENTLNTNFFAVANRYISVLYATKFEIVSSNQLIIRCQIFAKVVAASRLESI
jgi:hypothetical protein